MLILIFGHVACFAVIKCSLSYLVNASVAYHFNLLTLFKCPNKVYLMGGVKFNKCRFISTYISLFKLSHKLGHIFIEAT